MVRKQNAYFPKLFCVNHLLSVLELQRWLGQTHPSVPSPVATQGGEIRPNGELWATSTPDKLDCESVGFDGRRVRAWLGVQGPAPPRSTTSSSKAVQTDVEVGEVTCMNSFFDTHFPCHIFLMLFWFIFFMFPFFIF